MGSLLFASLPAPASAGPPPSLPDRLADTGGGSQLLVALAPDAASTTGRLSWWERRNGRWWQVGSAPARFGAGGLTEGSTRTQGTSTTPTGLFGLPWAFGLRPAPPGTSHPYRRVTPDSWWCQDNASSSYNRWVEPLPADCAPGEAERLADYVGQYAHALVVDYNYERPVRGRGAGIFLHVDGRGATAGCVSVAEPVMRELLRWADPGRRPHLAIGTVSGPLAVTRY
ncbi:L,D-transpeptidase family protein [Streptomyces sp. BI20]|uniref:L,D-transpeptidase family protein n=1 Tax=Streptomyces sp. BI20 TaxID=3403460 RepID=UPI003C75DE17